MVRLPCNYYYYFCQAFLLVSLSSGYRNKKGYEEKGTKKGVSRKRRFTRIQICVEGYNEKKKMIVRYAYRQNSIFHNKSQGHKQRTQVLERKESQANHIPIIICRRNSKIVSKEITDKSTTGSQKGQRAKQPSFLQFFPTS